MPKHIILRKNLSIYDNKKEYKSLEKSLEQYFRNKNKSENNSISSITDTQENLNLKEIINNIMQGYN